MAAAAKSRGARAALVGDAEGQRADDLARLGHQRVVHPLAAAAALGPALVGVALGAGVEAAQAVLLQAVAQVGVVTDEPAAFVILLQHLVFYRKILIHL